MTCPPEDDLLALVDGALPGVRAATVRAHIDACATCGELVALLAGRTEARAFGAPSRASAELAGARIGRYEMKERLGAGAMGVVFAAWDPRLQREVALKFVHAHSAGDGVRARLEREARAMARLSHPHVVTVYEVFEHEGDVVIAMELVHGGTLRQWLGARTRTVSEILAVFADAAGALQAAHAAGVLHRDFKPDNVLVGDDGRVRVTDFGLAVALPGHTEVLGQEALGGAVGADTRSSGTPAYMAPEQFQGLTADGRVDQFAFCVALHEALFGVRPFPGSTLADLRAAILGNVRVPLPQRRGVPLRLRRALDRGLAIDPALRLPSMERLRAELLPRRPLRRFVVAAVVLAALLVGGMLAWQRAARVRHCESGAAGISQVWNDASSLQISRTLGAAPSAPPAQTIVAALGDYARGWSAAFQEACLAQRDAAPERMACVWQRRDDLKAAVDVLAAAGPAEAVRALAIVNGLPALDACARSATAGEVPIPRDPTLAGAVKSALSDLALASVLVAAGKVRDAQALAAKVVVAARALGHAPLLAAAAYRLGESALEAGDYRAASGALVESVEAAIRGRAPGQEAAAWILRIRLCQKADPLPQCVELERFARAAVERAGSASFPSLDLVVGIDAAASNLQSGLGDYEKAYALQVRAQARAASLGAEYYLRGNLAAMASRIGRSEEAEALLRGEVARRRERLGANHPNVARAEFQLGAVLLDSGRAADSAPFFQSAIAIFERTPGPEHPDLAHFLGGLGEAFNRLGRLDDAARALRRALALKTRVFGAGHRALAESYAGLGSNAEERGAWEECASWLAKAAALLEREQLAGATAPLLYRSNQANALRELGRLRDAEALARPALAKLLATIGADRPETANAECVVAELDLARRNWKAALRGFQRALPAFQKARYSLGIIRARLGAAKAWRAQGDDKEALALVKAARDALAGEPAGASKPLRAQVAALLAELGESP